MKLLHRHIFANVALTCVASIALFGFVLMIGNVIKDLLGYVIAGQIEFTTFLHLLWLLVPFVVSYALPMGILTGVLLVLGRMSSDREITAIRASGVSVAGISAPIFFFALIGVVVSGAVNFYFMPQATMAYKRELAGAVQRNPLSFIVPKTFIRDFPGLVIYVGDMKGAQLKDVWVWKLDKENRVTQLHRAQSAEVHYDEANSKLQLVGHQVASEGRDKDDPEDFTKNPPMLLAEEFPRDLPIEHFTGQRTVRTKQKWQTLDMLLAERERLRQPDPNVPAAEREKQRIKVQTVIQEKASMAFSALSFALIAIPLGIKVSRKETSANLGVALVLVMAYYFATVAMGWFDKFPAARPDLLIWLPNIAIQSFGAWMFYRIDRQ